MKAVAEWTDQELEDKVKENLKIMLKTDGKGLSQQEKDLDGELKKEYWRREEAGLHKIPCMICTDFDTSYYEIMKEFSSDMTKLRENICQDHVEDFNRKAREFANNH